MAMVWYCPCITTHAVPNLPLHLPITREQDSEILELLGSGQNPLPTPLRLPGVAENQTTFVSATPHSAVNLSSACWRFTTKEAARSTSSAKSRCNREAPKLDTLQALAVPQHHALENQKQDRTALAESNTHRENTRLITENAKNSSQ